MSGHTPGPWEISDRIPPDLIEIGRCDADFDYDGEHMSVWEIVCTVNDNIDEIANARLIAAAPDLLDALKGILAITDRDHVAWEKARAAIAKAEQP